MTRLQLSLSATALAVCLGPLHAAAPGDVEFFEQKIRPALVEHCNACHANGKAKGGLDLSSRSSMLKGGETGAAIVVGDPDKSLLIAAIGYAGETQMPPKGKLGDAVIKDFTAWVRAGAIWPNAPTAKSDNGLRTGGDTISAEERSFWSFRPVSDPPVPAVKDAAWAKQPLDRFVLAKLESQGLRPGPTAEKRALLRRVTFDLIGLPPTAAEIDAFLADNSPDAFKRVVDRLLESPHYGERWARHWLDVARYGEDQAHTFQARLYPNGYRYRDWVAKAFQNDMAYDRFVLCQLAGDLLPDGKPEDRLPGLGFLALGMHPYADAGEAQAAEAAELDDKVDTLTRGLMGLTVSCARCHDHKFDPIPTRDYYSLAGVFKSTKYDEPPLVTPEQRARIEAEQAKLREKEGKTHALLDEETKRLIDGMSGQVARYATAAWKLHNMRKSGGISSPDFLKKEKSDLRPSTLDRWVEHLFNGDANGRAHLADWRRALADLDQNKNLSADDAALAKVKTAAEALEQRVKQYQREHDDLAKKPDAERAKKRDPARERCLHEIVSRDGVFRLEQAEAEALLSPEVKSRLASLRNDEEAVRKAIPQPPVVHALAEGQAADMKIALRGDPKKEGPVTPRRFLRVLAGDEPARFTQGSGRLELARAIASKDNPLTARVFVNRVWAWHFGKGLVATPSNFGKLGQRPTHPELLDHLTTRFIASGWSLKALHRDILASATYQLGCEGDPTTRQSDPGNALLGRMNRRRLDVESWRDALLSVCGNLDGQVGGPPTNLADSNNHRRTIYGSVSRHDLDSLLRLFDFPDPNLTSEARSATIVPLQQLFVLNSEFMISQARALTRQLAVLGPDDAARIRSAFNRLYGRPATADEIELGLSFLKSAGQSGGLSPWEQYSQVLLAANEFTFVD